MDFIANSSFLFILLINIIQSVLLGSTFYTVFHLNDKKKMKTLKGYVTVVIVEYVVVLAILYIIKGFYPYEQLAIAIVNNVLLLVYLGIATSKTDGRREVNFLKKTLYYIWFVGNVTSYLIFLNSI
ncbi:hypothetical protein ACQUY5_26875 [Bacillus cereus]|uniref:hypothetical protein n=1 Tax=Bacillus cereus TaxID=1396 RepID=UPI003D16D55C